MTLSSATRRLNRLAESLENKPQVIATVHRVDGSRVDLKFPGNATVLRNVRVSGSTEGLSIGQEILLAWDKVDGKSTPIAIAGGGGGSGGSGSGFYPDEVVITFGGGGLTVKEHSIQLWHLAFVPSLEGHEHDSGYLKLDASNDPVTGNLLIHADPLRRATERSHQLTIGKDSGDVGIHIFSGEGVPGNKFMDFASATMLEDSEILDGSNPESGWGGRPNIKDGNQASYAFYALDSGWTSTAIVNIVSNSWIPSGSVITGIHVTVVRGTEWFVNPRDRKATLILDGVAVGDDKSRGGAWVGNGDYGGAADLWGMSITPAMINGGRLGFGYQVTDIDSPGGGGGYIRLYEMMVRVYYSEVLEYSLGVHENSGLFSITPGSVLSDGGVTINQHRQMRFPASLLAPFIVNSTTLVDDLNADTVDGLHADYFAVAGHEHSASEINPTITNFDGWLGSTDQELQTALETLDDVGKVLQEPTGFVNRTSSALAVSQTTGAITFTPTNCEVWYRGRKTILTAQYITNAANAGANYLWWDGSYHWSTVPWDIQASVPIAYVLFNADNPGGSLAILFDERHGVQMDAATHRRLHYSIGTTIESGLAAGDYVIDSDVSSAKRISVSNGVQADEDIFFSNPGRAASAVFPVFYRYGLSEWRWRYNAFNANDDNTVPFIVQTDFVVANTVINGSYGFSDGGHNKYINYFIAAVPTLAPSGFEVISIMGQTIHSSASEAAAEMWGFIAWGTIPFAEIAPMYRLTFACTDGRTSIGKCVLSLVTDIRHSISGGSAASIYEHSGLTGRSNPSQHPGTAISVDVTGFGGNLSAADDTVQKALETLDSVGADGVSVNTTAFVGNLSALDDTVQKALETLDALVTGGGGTGSVATDTIWNAKGDLAVGTGSDTAGRLGVGADGCVLTSDSAEATGVKWATPSVEALKVLQALMFV